MQATLARALAHLPSVVDGRDRPAFIFGLRAPERQRFTDHAVDDAVMYEIAHPHQGLREGWRIEPQRRRDFLAGQGLNFFERLDAGL